MANEVHEGVLPPLTVPEDGVPKADGIILGDADTCLKFVMEILDFFDAGAENAIRAVGNGVVELLVRAMQLHTRSAEVQACVLFALSELAKTGPQAAELILEEGAPAVLHNILQVHVSNGAVQEQGQILSSILCAAEVFNDSMPNMSVPEDTFDTNLPAMDVIHHTGSVDESVDTYASRFLPYSMSSGNRLYMTSIFSSDNSAVDDAGEDEFATIPSRPIWNGSASSPVAKQGTESPYFASVRPQPRAMSPQRRKRSPPRTRPQTTPMMDEFIQSYDHTNMFSRPQTTAGLAVSLPKLKSQRQEASSARPRRRRRDDATTPRKSPHYSQSSNQELSTPRDDISLSRPVSQAANSGTDKHLVFDIPTAAAEPLDPVEAEKKNIQKRIDQLNELGFEKLHAQSTLVSCVGEWEKCQHDATGQVYYYNRKSGEVKWSRRQDFGRPATVPDLANDSTSLATTVESMFASTATLGALSASEKELRDNMSKHKTLRKIFKQKKAENGRKISGEMLNLFRLLDGENTGRVTVEQFERGLSCMGLPVHEGEIFDMLIDLGLVAEDNIDYEVFCTSGNISRIGVQEKKVDVPVQPWLHELDRGNKDISPLWEVHVKRFHQKRSAAKIWLHRRGLRAIQHTRDQHKAFKHLVVHGEASLAFEFLVKSAKDAYVQHIRRMDAVDFLKQRTTAARRHRSRQHECAQGLDAIARAALHEQRLTRCRHTNYQRAFGLQYVQGQARAFLAFRVHKARAHRSRQSDTAKYLASLAETGIKHIDEQIAACEYLAGTVTRVRRHFSEQALARKELKIRLMATKQHLQNKRQAQFDLQAGGEFAVRVCEAREKAYEMLSTQATKAVRYYNRLEIAQKFLTQRGAEAIHHCENQDVARVWLESRADQVYEFIEDQVDARSALKQLSTVAHQHVIHKVRAQKFLSEHLRLAKRHYRDACAAQQYLLERVDSARHQRRLEQIALDKDRVHVAMNALKAHDKQAHKERKHLSPEERIRAEIKDAFDSYDLDGSGEIDKTEFYGLVTDSPAIKVPPEQIPDCFSQIDVDKSGAVDFEEFLLWYRHELELAHAGGSSDIHAVGDLKGRALRKILADILAGPRDADEYLAEMVASLKEHSHGMSAKSADPTELHEMMEDLKRKDARLAEERKELTHDERALLEVGDAFDSFDVDGSMSLDRFELAQLLDEVCIPANVNEMFDKIDEDNSGTISLDEFSGWYRGQLEALAHRRAGKLFKQGKALLKSAAGQKKLEQRALRALEKKHRLARSKEDQERAQALEPPNDHTVEDGGQAKTDRQDTAEVKKVAEAVENAGDSRKCEDGDGGEGEDEEHTGKSTAAEIDSAGEDEEGAEDGPQEKLPPGIPAAAAAAEILCLPMAPSRSSRLIGARAVKVNNQFAMVKIAQDFEETISSKNSGGVAATLSVFMLHSAAVYDFELDSEEFDRSQLVDIVATDENLLAFLQGACEIDRFLDASSDSESFEEEDGAVEEEHARQATADGGFAPGDGETASARLSLAKTARKSSKRKRKSRRVSEAKARKEPEIPPREPLHSAALFQRGIVIGDKRRVRAVMRVMPPDDEGTCTLHMCVSPGNKTYDLPIARRHFAERGFDMPERNAESEPGWQSVLRGLRLRTAGDGSDGELELQLGPTVGQQSASAACVQAIVRGFVQRTRLALGKSPCLHPVFSRGMRLSGRLAIVTVAPMHSGDFSVKALDVATQGQHGLVVRQSQLVSWCWDNGVLLAQPELDAATASKIDMGAWLRDWKSTTKRIHALSLTQNLARCTAPLFVASNIMFSRGKSGDLGLVWVSTADSAAAVPASPGRHKRSLFQPAGVPAAVAVSLRHIMLQMSTLGDDDGESTTAHDEAVSPPPCTILRVRELLDSSPSVTTEALLDDADFSTWVLKRVVFGTGRGAGLRSRGWVLADHALHVAVTESNWAVVHWIHLWDGSHLTSASDLVLPESMVGGGGNSLDTPGQQPAFVLKGIRLDGEYFLVRASDAEETNGGGGGGGVRLTLFSVRTDTTMSTELSESDLKTARQQEQQRRRLPSDEQDDDDVGGDGASDRLAFLEYVITQIPILCLLTALRRASNTTFSPR